MTASQRRKADPARNHASEAFACALCGTDEDVSPRSVTFVLGSSSDGINSCGSLAYR